MICILFYFAPTHHHLASFELFPNHFLSSLKGARLKFSTVGSKHALSVEQLKLSLLVVETSDNKTNRLWSFHDNITSGRQCMDNGEKFEDETKRGEPVA